MGRAVTLPNVLQTNINLIGSIIPGMLDYLAMRWIVVPKTQETP